MIPGPQIAAAFAELGITHVVILPDAVIGEWDEALAASNDFDLVRVCREGEAWALAFGLYLGGAVPLVVIQSTGLFESGDALRNILFDLGMPIHALVGYRNYLKKESKDTARKFTEPILAAWGLEHVLIETAADLPRFAEHFHAGQASGRPGVTLLAEGKT